MHSELVYFVLKDGFYFKIYRVTTSDQKLFIVL